MLSVDDWVGIGSLELAGRAAEAIRELNHRTRGPGAFTGPAELYRLVAELVVLAGGMPQLLGQLDRWLRVEHDAGRVRSDDRADPGPTVRGAARDWSPPARPRTIWPMSWLPRSSVCRIWAWPDGCRPVCSPPREAVSGAGQGHDSGMPARSGRPSDAGRRNPRRGLVRGCWGQFSGGVGIARRVGREFVPWAVTVAVPTNHRTTQGAPCCQRGNE